MNYYRTRTPPSSFLLILIGELIITVANVAAAGKKAELRFVDDREGLERFFSNGFQFIQWSWERVGLEEKNPNQKHDLSKVCILNLRWLFRDEFRFVRDEAVSTITCDANIVEPDPSAIISMTEIHLNIYLNRELLECDCQTLVELPAGPQHLQDTFYLIRRMMGLGRLNHFTDGYFHLLRTEGDTFLNPTSGPNKYLVTYYYELISY